MFKTQTRLALVASLLLPMSLALAETPRRLAPAPGPDAIAAPATISNEAPVERNTIEPERVPECQIRIGEQWINERVPSFEACAALLDAKAPYSKTNMSTAFWNGLHIAVDDKTVYKADAQSDWIVLRPRAKR